MEWFDFSGWESDVFRQPYSVRSWSTSVKLESAPPSNRQGVAEQLEAFVRACPDALLRQVAPPPELR